MNLLNFTTTFHNRGWLFHDIRPEYLQNYLNEFCYKFNRRYFGDPQLGRLLVASATYKNDFRYHMR
jgi:hypothetical protein